MSTGAALSIQGLSFRRNDRVILDQVDWQVGAGEHWVILGPNGCGKTSLINCLTGYEMASAGSITVDGSQYGQTDWREVRKRVGLVAATLGRFLDNHEPVIEAVVSGREAVLNMTTEVDDALRREAESLLVRFGCGHLVNSRWGVLSQGERQKILICRALMAQFHVLILDEPCAGLDPVAREKFLHWLADLAVEPGAPSMVLVTHHVEEILPCFTRVLLMKEGRILAQGEKAVVLQNDLLTEAYGAPVEISSEQERYYLKISA